MDKHIENELLRFAVNISGEAKIETKKLGQMKGLRKVVTLQDKTYLYNPNNLSRGLLTKINKLSKTHKYKEANEIKKIYLKHRRNNALKSYAVKYKANISETQSLFQSYSNDKY